MAYFEVRIQASAVVVIECDSIDEAAKWADECVSYGDFELSDAEAIPIEDGELATHLAHASTSSMSNGERFPKPTLAERDAAMRKAMKRLSEAAP